MQWVAYHFKNSNLAYPKITMPAFIGLNLWQSGWIGPQFESLGCAEKGFRSVLHCKAQLISAWLSLVCLFSVQEIQCITSFLCFWSIGWLINWLIDIAVNLPKLELQSTCLLSYISFLPLHVTVFIFWNGTASVLLIVFHVRCVWTS